MKQPAQMRPDPVLVAEVNPLHALLRIAARAYALQVLARVQEAKNISINNQQ